MTDPPEPAAVRVHAQAHGNAQQAVLGQGVQNNYFYAATVIAQQVVTLVPAPLGMTGREAERARLREVAGRARDDGGPVAICTVHGMGGVGKTALTRALAAEVADDFPDARLEVDLCGFTPGKPPREPMEVLGELLGLVGFGAADVPAGPEGRSQLWRAWLAGHGVLLVLDNARDAAQLRPLLPGTGVPGRCLVLVTSRNRLPDLDVALSIGVGTMPVADAVTLMIRTAGAPPGLDPDRPELTQLAELCGCLPLALRPVGHLLGDVDADDLVELMRSSRRPLEHLHDADSAAAAAYAVSYEALSPASREVLEACSRHPGPDFDAASIGAVCGRPAGLAAVLLAELLRANMLTGLPGRRYTFLDLFLGYTRDQAAGSLSAAEVTAAMQRLCTDLNARLAAASALVYVDNQNLRAPEATGTAPADPAAARRWLQDAAGELITCALRSLAENFDGNKTFALSLAYWMHAEGRPDAALRLYTSLAERARAAGDLPTTASALAGLGLVSWSHGDLDRAEESFRGAHDLFTGLGNENGRADGIKGVADVLRTRGGPTDLAAAVGAYREADAVYAGLGDVRGRVDSLNGKADTHLLLGERDEAAATLRTAHRLATDAGYRSGRADALCGLGDLALGNVARGGADDGAAAAAYGEAREIYRAIGNRHGLAYSLKGLGDVGLLTGEDSAMDAYLESLALYEQLGFAHYQVRILSGLATMAQARGQEAVAAAYLSRAATLARPPGKAGDHAESGSSRARQEEFGRWP